MLLRSDPDGSLHTQISGIVFDQPDAEYRALKRLSQSDCKLIDEAPALYWHQKTHPEYRKTTPAMLFGQALHCACLTPDEFDKTFAIAPPKGAFKGRGAAIAKAAYLETVAGKALISNAQMVQVELMRRALFRHPLARALLWDLPGKPEVSGLWTSQIDPAYPPVLCKGRFDRVVQNGASDLIVDIKTCECADPREFPRHAFYDYGYHVQAASYLDGYADAAQKKPEAFIFVAIEKRPPYLVCCYVADEEFLNLGRAQYLKSVKTFAECSVSGKWPGYSETLVSLSGPRRKES